MKEDEIFQFAQSSQVTWVLGHFRTLTNAELTTFDFLKAAGTCIHSKAFKVFSRPWCNIFSDMGQF